MSHTKRGSKFQGYEYWSKRPGNGFAPGRWSKTHTHRLERQQGKRQVRIEELRENT